MVFIGVDCGGTFTDLVAFDTNKRTLQVLKVPSTPDRPSNAVIEGLEAFLNKDQGDPLLVIVGTTVGVNSVIQRKGARVLFLTTEGIEDVPFIQRINKRYSYNLKWTRPAPLVRRADCIGIPERIDAYGNIVTPLPTEGEWWDRIVAKIEGGAIESVAVCLLFSYLNPAHEVELKKRLTERFPAVAVSISSEVSPIWKEYERGSTTIVDAYVKPSLVGFSTAIEERLAREKCQCTLTLMKSNGGRMLAENARQASVQTLLSGLGGGVMAGVHYSQAAQELNAVTLDMGGTSCDVGLIVDGSPRYTTEFEIEWGMPVSIPVIDVNTIGAGGGSIGWIDKGGLLRVGPQSAGADPGPACYGKGGVEPTVTDANLVLGRLNPTYFLGGKMPLQVNLAKASMDKLAKTMGVDSTQASEAIISIANENMANAIRLVTIERGLDPREFSLIAFGGAGPLHAAAVAELTGIKKVIIPPHPGLCSAFGSLITAPRVDKVWTHFCLADAADVESINCAMDNLVADALAEIQREGLEGQAQIRRTVSMRYKGQNYEHEVELRPGPITDQSIKAACQDFHILHKKLYGYSHPGEVLEIVFFNVTITGQPSHMNFPEIEAGPMPKPKTIRQVHFKETGFVMCPIYKRDDLRLDTVIKGPAVIEEVDSTTLVAPGQTLKVQANGAMLVIIQGQES